MIRSKQTLLVILIFSQFAGTSVWFATNAVVDSLPAVSKGNVATLTSAVQAGFIAGTLVFALLGVADRFAASKVFFISSIIASAANLFVIWTGNDFFLLLALRFLTGFFLAGIYPVGMKIAADLFPEKIGKALGWLVGALVLGTSLPHFIRWQTTGLKWENVLIATSLLAFIGGLMVLLLIPAKQKILVLKVFKLSPAFKAFRSQPFRSAAFGYFGHMWELYALWSMLPLLFQYYNQLHQSNYNIYLLSFAIIAIGGLGCAMGGLLSIKCGSRSVAFYSLLTSGICCLLAPLFFQLSFVLFIAAFIIWGFSVTADSPQFSALVAKHADEKTKGTALTIVTSIGFSITIISIQLLKAVFAEYNAYSLWLLAVGPLLGLIALRSKASI